MGLRNNLQISLLLVTLFILVSTMYVGPSLIDSKTNVNERNEIMKTRFFPSTFIIDGTLSPGEWDDAEHKTMWFINASPSNTDGYNYMYLAEDLDNLYIAIDLCSDTTNDPTGEWLGLWLNTNETFTNTSTVGPWEAALNAGLESLVYDVDNDMEIPFFRPDGSVFGYATEMQSIDDLIQKNGTFSGSLNDLTEWNDGLFANMTSEFNGTDYIY